MAIVILYSVFLFVLSVVIQISAIFIFAFLQKHYIQYYSKTKQSPLDIETFDGSNSPYHPSVLFFGDSWNNYKFWLAETPFPLNALPYRDRWESPCIHVSNDGIHWGIPIGFNNPIDDLTETQIADKDFFSDPHLVMKDSTLECWYRLSYRGGKNTYKNNTDHHLLLRKKSSDGINWSPRELIFDITEKYKTELVSPSIIYQDYYYLWVVDAENDKYNHTVKLISSKDEISWSSPIQCVFCGPQLAPWHIDVSYIDGFYWLVCYNTYGSLTLWKSHNKTHFQFIKTLLQPTYSDMSFYSNQLYRSSLCKVNDEDYRLYFSASNDSKTCIGVMKGTSMETLEVYSVDNKDYQSFLFYLRSLLLRKFKTIVCSK